MLQWFGRKEDEKMVEKIVQNAILFLTAFLVLVCVFLMVTMQKFWAITAVVLVILLAICGVVAWRCLKCRK